MPEEEYFTLNASSLQLKIINPETKKVLSSFKSRIAIVSWVELEDWDKPDGIGTVKTVACGTPEQLNALMLHTAEYVQHGSMLAAKQNTDDFKN